MKTLLESRTSFSERELAGALYSAALAVRSEIVRLSHGVIIDEDESLGACTFEEPAAFPAIHQPRG